MSSNDYRRHPLAKLFPELDEKTYAYSALKETVRIQGVFGPDSATARAMVLVAAGFG
jgi:hypothetical protein